MVNWLEHSFLPSPSFSWWFAHLFLSLSFSSSTLPSPKNMKLTHPSLSLHAMINSSAYTMYSIHQVRIHQVQHTPSTAYTQYSIHPVQHTPSTAYTECSIHRLQHTPSLAYSMYCIHHVLIIRRSTVPHSQPVSELSANLVGLNSLHSHNYKLTNE